MLEYGIKTITTNPTLITKATEIIRLVDSRSNQTRAFVLPVIYEDIIEKLVKELEYRKLVEEKKAKLAKSQTPQENLDDMMELGMESTNLYMKDDK